MTDQTNYPHPSEQPITGSHQPTGFQPQPTGFQPQPLASPAAPAPQTYAPPLQQPSAYAAAQQPQTIGSVSGPTTVYVQQGPTVLPKNGAAVAALVLGIAGFFLTDIPLFVGLFLGGIPDILAIVFAIVALNRAPRLQGSGKALAIWGLVLGGLGFLSMFIGAGTIW